MNLNASDSPLTNHVESIQPISTRAEMRALQKEASEKWREPENIARKRLRAHFRAVEQDPERALGPDTNNFYSIFVPQYHKYRGLDDLEAILDRQIADGRRAMATCSVDEEHFRQVCEAYLRSTEPTTELYEEFYGTLAKLFKAMRAIGYKHCDLCM